MYTYVIIPLPPPQLLWVLEHLASVTAQPPETPNERNFQAQYGETINSALQRLKNPANYANPHTVWEPFKEVRTGDVRFCCFDLPGIIQCVTPNF